MEVFACICLIVIIISLQHVLNWLWRKAESEDISDVGVIMVSIFLLLITWFCIVHLVKWLHPLIV